MKFTAQFENRAAYCFTHSPAVCGPSTCVHRRVRCYAPPAPRCWCARRRRSPAAAALPCRRLQQRQRASARPPAWHVWTCRRHRCTASEPRRPWRPTARSPACSPPPAAVQNPDRPTDVRLCQADRPKRYGSPQTSTFCEVSRLRRQGVPPTHPHREKAASPK